MVKKLSRRDFLKTGALAFAGATLAACGQKAGPDAADPGTDPMPVDDEPVTLQYWMAWGGYPDAWAMVAALPEYEEYLGKNIVEARGGVNAEAFLTAVAGGEPPDVASHPSGQYLDYMARGVLLDVSELTAASDVISGADAYFPTVWDNGFWEGKQYCVPGNEGFIRSALFYNTRMVEEAGLDPDTPPVTWTELLAWHDKLNQFDSAGNLIKTGIDPYDAMGGSLQFDNGWYGAQSWGVDWFDVEAGTFNLDNDGIAESMEVMGEFHRMVGPDNMAAMFTVEGQGHWGGAFYSEVQAMTIQGYWTAGGVANNKPEVSEVTRATWAPVPESRKGDKIQTTGGHYILFFKDAPNAAKAFKVAELVNTDPACDAIFESLGWLPAKLSYLEKADRDRYNGLGFFFDAIDETTHYYAPERCQITAFVQTQYTELREKVYRDEMTGKDAAAEMQKRCEEEWVAAGLG